MPIFILFLDCQCYPEGTMEYTNPSGVKQCNNDTGICTCKEGYAGDKCETCDTGYYDQNINDTSLDVSCLCNFFCAILIFLAIICFHSECIFLACGCYDAGTNQTDGKPICSIETGICECAPGYQSNICYQCSNGYYDVNDQDSTMDLSCTGKYYIYHLKCIFETQKIKTSHVACTHCGFNDIYNIGDGINGTLGYCHPQSGHCMCKNGIQCQTGYNTSAGCTSCESGYDMYPYCMDDGSSTTPSIDCMIFKSCKYFVFSLLIPRH